MSWQISWQKIKLQIKFDFQTCLPKGTNILLENLLLYLHQDSTKFIDAWKAFKLYLTLRVNIKTLLHWLKNADKWFVVIKDDSFVHFVETLMKFTDNTFLECTEISLFLCWRGWMPYYFNIVSTSILHYLFTWLYFDFILESLILLFHYQWWISRIFYC